MKAEAVLCAAVSCIVLATGCRGPGRKPGRGDPAGPATSAPARGTPADTRVSESVEAPRKSAPEAAVAWGEAVNGVQLGIARKGGTGPVPFDGLAPLRVHVRNVGGKSFRFPKLPAMVRAQGCVMLEAFVDGKRPMPRASGTPGAVRPEDYADLAPGATDSAAINLGPYGSGLNVGDKAEVVFVLDSRNFSMEWDPVAKKTRKMRDAWHGKVRSGAVEIEITAKGGAAAGTAGLDVGSAVIQRVPPTGETRRAATLLLNRLARERGSDPSLPLNLAQKYDIRKLPRLVVGQPGRVEHDDEPDTLALYLAFARRQGGIAAGEPTALIFRGEPLDWYDLYRVVSIRRRGTTFSVECERVIGPPAVPSNVVTMPLIRAPLGRLEAGRYRAVVNTTALAYTKHGHPETATRIPEPQPSYEIEFEIAAAAQAASAKAIPASNVRFLMAPADFLGKKRSGLYAFHLPVGKKYSYPHLFKAAADGKPDTRFVPRAGRPVTLVGKLPGHVTTLDFFEAREGSITDADIELPARFVRSMAATDEAPPLRDVYVVVDLPPLGAGRYRARVAFKDYVYDRDRTKIRLPLVPEPARFAPLTCEFEVAAAGAEKARGPSPRRSGFGRAGGPPLFPVVKGGKYGYIDATGRMVISPRFDQASWRFSVSARLAPVRLGSKWGYIDRSGKFASPLRFDYARPFSEGLATVAVGGKAGFIDDEGKLVVDLRFPRAGGFNEGLAPVKLSHDGHWGYIDKSGALVIKPRFDAPGPFSEGLASVGIGGKFGYIDRSGAFVIEPRFTRAGRFYEGMAWSKIGGKRGFIDREGGWVIDPRFGTAGHFSEGLTFVCDRDKYGYVDKTGKFVIRPRFDGASEFHEGLARVKIGGKWGYIVRTGEVVIEPRFDKAGDFYDGLARVSVGGRWVSAGRQLQYVDGREGYVDKTGRYVWEPTR